VKKIKGIIFVIIFMPMGIFGQTNSLNESFSDYISSRAFNFAEIEGNLFSMQKAENENSGEANIYKIQILAGKDSLLNSNFEKDALLFIGAYEKLMESVHENKKMQCHAKYTNGSISQLLLLVKRFDKIVLINIEGEIDQESMEIFTSPKGITDLENVII